MPVLPCTAFLHVNCYWLQRLCLACLLQSRSSRRTCVVNMVAAHAACTRHSFCSRGKLAHGMQVVHEFSDAKEPLQLSSHSLGVSQAQQAQQAAADQLVGVSNLTVSSTGKWAAVVKGSHVHVFELEAMTYHGRLPALQVGVPAPSCCLAVLLCTVYMSCAFR